MRLGGTARLLVEPEESAAALDLVAFLQRESIDFRPIGGGSNVLPPDGGSDLIVVATRRLDGVALTGTDPVLLRAGAGAPLQRLVALTAKEGLSGLEPLAGIPGTVGGAVVMNAGGRHGCIESVFEEAVVAGRDGGPRIVKRGRCGFRYRGSNLGRHLVLEVVLRLGRCRPEDACRRIDAIVGEKKRTQPLGKRSCGCIFKNPEGHSAGKLIDQAGLKGATHGAACISSKHANFMINRGGATRSDFDALIDTVRARVRSLFQIDLELEVERW